MHWLQHAAIQVRRPGGQPMVEIRLLFCVRCVRCLLCLGGNAWKTGQTMRYENPSTQGSTSIRIVRPPRIRADGAIDFCGRTETGNRDDADGLLVLLRPTSVGNLIEGNIYVLNPSQRASPHNLR